MQVPTAQTIKSVFSRVPTWAWFVLVFLLFSADLFLDIRHRDVFTWMDPYQYFAFAKDVLDGTRAFNDFVLPSIFPFFLMPFLAVQPTVPLALSANILFAGILVLAVYHLCDALGMRSHAALASLLLLSSPLLIGLSRSLYAEFLLAAVVCAGYVFWLKSRDLTRRVPALLFGLTLAVGFMLKPTYPIFFAGPFAVVLVWALRGKDLRAAGRLVLAFLVPFGAVLAVEYLAFPKSFPYYVSAGGSTIPVNVLAGPQEVFSAASVFYYFSHVWKSMLLALSPFLAVTVHAAVRDPAVARKREHWMLLAWLVVPMLLLVAFPVKEPRHMAPCVLAGVLLVLVGVASLRGARARVIVACALAAAALLQYGAVTFHFREAPYFLDRPSGGEAIRKVMMENDRHIGSYSRGGVVDALRWNFARNVAIAGFDPNMSTALAWFLKPGVMYDLDLFPRDEGKILRTPYSRFEDLFIYSAFNSLNRRNLWDRFYYTLDRETVLEYADFLVVEGGGEADPAARYPGFRTGGVLDMGGRSIHVLVSDRPAPRSYRNLYARRFLERNPDLDKVDYDTVCMDLLMDAVLRKDFGEYHRIMSEYPARYKGEFEGRNIYWISHYATLKEKMTEILGSYLESRRQQR